MTWLRSFLFLMAVGTLPGLVLAQPPKGERGGERGEPKRVEKGPERGGERGEPKRGEPKEARPDAGPNIRELEARLESLRRQTAEIESLLKQARGPQERREPAPMPQPKKADGPKDGPRGGGFPFGPMGPFGQPGGPPGQGPGGGFGGSFGGGFGGVMKAPDPEMMWNMLGGKDKERIKLDDTPMLRNMAERLGNLPVKDGYLSKADFIKAMQKKMAERGPQAGPGGPPPVERRPETGRKDEGRGEGPRPGPQPRIEEPRGGPQPPPPPRDAQPREVKGRPDQIQPQPIPPRSNQLNPQPIPPRSGADRGPEGRPHPEQGPGGPPPMSRGGFGGPPPMDRGFGGPPPMGGRGFGGPPMSRGGFGGPPPMGGRGFGGPPVGRPMSRNDAPRGPGNSAEQQQIRELNERLTRIEQQLEAIRREIRRR